MKGKTDIQKFGSSLCVFGLVLLLSLLPCKVRNFIEAELGIPQTEVLNKNKTTLSHFSCERVEISENALTSAKASMLYLMDIAIGSSILVFEQKNPVGKSIGSYPAGNLTISSIPFYILYLNIKVHRSSIFL